MSQEKGQVSTIGSFIHTFVHTCPCPKILVPSSSYWKSSLSYDKVITFHHAGPHTCGSGLLLRLGSKGWQVSWREQTQPGNISLCGAAWAAVARATVEVT